MKKLILITTLLILSANSFANGCQSFRKMKSVYNNSLLPDINQQIRKHDKIASSYRNKIVPRVNDLVMSARRGNIKYNRIENMINKLNNKLDNADRGQNNISELIYKLNHIVRIERDIIGRCKRESRRFIGSTVRPMIRRVENIDRRYGDLMRNIEFNIDRLDDLLW